MTNQINVGIVGTKFMGRAHSSAYLSASRFFDLPARPVLRAACGRNEADLEAFARRFGWQTTEMRWEDLVGRDDVDLVDICTGNASHMPIAVAAARAGKHILCEKPMALDASQALRMLEAAEEAGVCHMMAFNYRRVPAIALARQLIQEDKIGQVRHFNAAYYQDWLVDPAYGYTWRHDARKGGSGAHGDLNAHTVDLARYLVGEVDAVSAAQETFVKERPVPGSARMAPVTVDDSFFFLARFRGGALGTFMATRVATGRRNMLRLEIFGSKGALGFNLERLNELEFYSEADGEREQGYRTILVTEESHPYLRAWWPTGHVLGWEHTFVHEVRDLLLAIYENRGAVPSFYDGLRCQQVLDAALESAREGTWVEVAGG